MTKKRIVYVILAGVLISAVIILLGMGQANKNRKNAALEQEAVETLPAVDYVLGEYEGQLALFRGDQAEPYQILDMPVQLLSAYDREQIAAGIHVQTEIELRTLVEDFAS